MREHIGFLLLEDFTHLAFSCALEPLRIANLEAGRPLYRWTLASADGAPARCSNGTLTQVDCGFDALPDCDRVFVVSGQGVQAHGSDALKACLRRQQAAGAGLGALCSGAWVLARFGLLDGARAAIHWAFHDAFAEAFARVELVTSVFVADQPRITASGGTASADLMLHLIERTHGAALGNAVADQMVFPLVRDGSARQCASLQARVGARNSHLVRATELMQQRIDEPLSIATLSREVGVSRRQLERLFNQHLNCTPKRYFLELRVQRARNLLVQTDCTVLQAAVASGFESCSHFSRIYRGYFGVSPSQQRRKVG